MFDITRPCVDCPARKGNGERYQMRRARLESIIEGPAFQCHKTVNYTEDENGDCLGEAGSRPQQCAGIMAVLHRSGRHNAIMQVAIRLDELDPECLDPGNEAYDNIDDMMAAHGHIAVPASEDKNG